MICEFCERGLEAPSLDYDTPQPCLEAICDPLDPDGIVCVPHPPVV